MIIRKVEVLENAFEKQCFGGEQLKYAEWGRIFIFFKGKKESEAIICPYHFECGKQ